MSLRLALTLVALSTAGLCHADTIASATGGGSGNSFALYAGQSFTVTGAGSYNNITFNFFSPAGSAYAVGQGYLFASAYTGTPSGLSASTAGVLGSATAANNLYSFGSALALLSGQQYFFYESAQIPANGISGNVSYAGGNFFLASNNTSTYSSIASANFTVTGTPAAVAVTPEPSGFVLLGTGLLGVVGMVKRRLV